MKTMSRALFAAALFPTIAAAQSVTAPPIAPITGTRLDIVAEGETARVPDLATISAGVVTQADTAAAAMSDNAARMRRVVAALRSAGIAERDIQTGSINLSPQYRYAENQPPAITGYQASNQLSVRFREVGRAGRVLDALVAQGANQISGPNFTIERADQALDEARTAAIAKARARAELYARAAGLQVRRILAISETGGFPQPPMPMPVMMRAESKQADTMIAPGEQRLGVTLSVSFELG